MQMKMGHLEGTTSKDAADRDIYYATDEILVGGVADISSREQ